MTQLLYPTLTRSFHTKSGRPLLLGTGSGTKWKDIRRARKEADPTLDLVPEVVEPIKLAIDNGFYHIDTAEVYTTHPEVAEAIRQSGVNREDLWITTKYFPGIATYAATSQSPTEFIDNALKELKTDYIDLLLIHCPFFTAELSHGYDLAQVWQQLIQAKKDGKVREIGASNFAVRHLKEVIAAAGSPEYYPVVNQIEFHPYLQNQSDGIVEFAKQNNILLEAYSPLTPIFRVNKDGKDVVDHPLAAYLPQLAAKYSRTEAQVLLRYTLQKGLLPITTSSKAERIRQSLLVYEFALEDADVVEIDRLGLQFSHRSFFVDEFEALK